MIGYDVENLTKTSFNKLAAKPFVSGQSAKLLIDGLMIHYVVAMRASGRGLKVWRGVEVRHAEVPQII